MMRASSRFITRVTAIVLVAITWQTQTAISADTAKSKKPSKTEYIRSEPGDDPAKASRAFDAKWKAIFIATPWPEYPYEARRNHITGKGLLRIYVDESGKVTDVKILKSTENRQLDDAGLTAFRHWRAKPGARREVDMPLTFVMSGTGRRSSDHGPGFKQDGLGLQGYRDR